MSVIERNVEYDKGVVVVLNRVGRRGFVEKGIFEFRFVGSEGVG